VNTDDCVSRPCMNNGTCVDLVAGYKCECATLYTGNHCESSELSFINGACLKNILQYDYF
jgi:Notch-like protein